MSASVPLQLGDIVGVIAPSNPDLNNKYFVVNYLSLDQLVLTGEDGVDHQLRMEDGQLGDTSIKALNVVQHADQPGYARQHELIPGEWINIHFGGDMPMIVVGKIVGLDEDMIDVKTWPSNEHIYIDFAYKGVPPELEIIDIEKRSVPMGAEGKQPSVIIDISNEIPEDTDVAIVDTSSSLTPDSPVVPESSILEPSEEEISDETAVSTMQDELVAADSIVYGAELGNVVQSVEVDEHRRKYPIEAQLNDMLDDMLASIPPAKRTTSRLLAIQTTLERYKQLRKEFSLFDEYGTPMHVKVKGAQYRPLAENLSTLTDIPKWIIPISKNIRKVYDVEGEPPYGDVVQLNLHHQLEAERELIEAYQSENVEADGDNARAKFLTTTESFSIPYENIPRSEALHIVPVNGNTLSLLDNLDNEESSVFIDGCCIKKKRFYKQSHSAGLTGLVPVEHAPGTAAYAVDNIVPPETIAVTGVAVMPLSVAPTMTALRPGSLIGNRMQAATFRSEIEESLVNGTPTETILVTEFGKDSERFATSELVVYELDEPLYTDDDRWRKFLDAIVPPTKNVIGMMSAYAKQSLSILSLSYSLSPFAIDISDISYRQYDKMSKVLHSNISDYRRRLGQRRNAYDRLARIRDSAFARYREPFRLPTGLLDDYGINPKSLPLVIIAEAIKLDGGTAFISAIGESGATSQYGISPEEYAETALVELSTRKPGSTLCDTRVIAVVYESEESLVNSNESPAYYSTDRDPTDYTLAKRFPNHMNSEEELANMIDFLTINVGMSDEHALREARAVTEGRREVAAGEYAILAVPGQPIKYFLRDRMKWVEQPDIQPSDFIPDNNLFCIMDDDCSYMKQCTSNENVEHSDEVSAIKLATKGFELESNIVSEHSKQKRIELLKQSRTMLSLIRRIAEIPAAKLRRYRISLAASVASQPDIESPYTNLISAILAQNDFSKKQGDIIRFSSQYTVPGRTNWMRECKETGLPLLPSFLVSLAEAFTRGTYQNELDQICRLQGVLSDNGDSWVDKHTGYLIRFMEFDTSEGYDESGYQIVSRDLVQQDIAESVLQRVYSDSETAAIANVVKGFTLQLGVKIDGSIDFITKEVRTLLKDLLPERKTYEARVKGLKQKGKTGVPYEFAYNSMMLYLTLCMVLVSIQTAIPSIRPTRSFPNCKRSFEGFPLDSTPDMPGLAYIACVASRMKGDTSPWNTLKRMKEPAIKKKLESVLSRVAKSPTVRSKISEKKSFIADNPLQDEDIGPEYDVRQWATFLPPLSTTTAEPVRQLPDAYFRDLVGKINESTPESIIDLVRIMYKTRHLSFGIQEAIQSVVDANSPILQTMQGIPFIENGCCNDNRKSTFEFFSEESPVIAAYARFARMNMLKFRLLSSIHKAPSFLNIANTRTPYYKVSDTISETVIYKVMLHYCQYNMPTFIGDRLTQICGKRMGPPIDGLDIKEAIDALKAEGIDYNEDTMNNVLIHLADDNMLTVKSGQMPQPAQRLQSVITATNIDPDTPILGELKTVFDMYGVRLDDAKTEVNALRNAVLKVSEAKIEVIKRFLRKSNAKLKPVAASFLQDLLTWSPQPSTFTTSSGDATAAKVLGFSRMATDSISRVIPGIISHEVRYADVLIPKAWNLSQRHVGDIKAFIAKEYADLAKFYGDTGVAQVCDTVLTRNNPVLMLQKLTVLLPEHRGELSVLNERVIRELSQYYVVECIHSYIEVVEEMTSSSTEPSQGPEDTLEMATVVDDPVTASAAITITMSQEISSQELAVRVSDLLVAIINTLAESKRISNVGAAVIKERTLKAREKEKDEITSYLRDLSDEERQAQDVLKNNRLGKWGKGHTKGLVHYVQDVYDAEVAALEQRAAIDNRLGEMSEVTAMNRDIYALDIEQQDKVAEDIDGEVADLSGLANDDDYGDLDGDEDY